MSKFEELMENEEFVAKLEKCENESDLEALRAEYADSVEIESELDEEALEEVAGGGKVCNALGNCKYICTKCGKTFATETMAKSHFLKMSFKGGGLKHTYKKIK